MPISKFDYSVFDGQSELSFLHLKHSFEIDFSDNTIVFAFNGTCKTTIANFLNKHYPDQFFLINYEEDKNLIKAVKTGKTIDVLPDVVSLQRAKSELQSVKDQIDIFRKIENSFGVGKSKIASSNISYLKTIKNNDCASQISLTEEEFNEINEILLPIKTEFGKHFRDLIDGVHNVMDEIEDMQSGLVKDFCEKYLSHLQIDEDPLTCPICNGNIENGLRSCLNDKLARLTTVVSPFFADYLVQNTQQENENFLLSLSNLIAKYRGLESKLCEYMLISDYSEIASFNALVGVQTSKQTDVTTAEANVTSISSGIHDSELFIKDLFVGKLGFKNAKYDSKKKGLVLTVPDDRPAASYSQGELNLITLMTRLTIAKSTDKTNIVIDDPLSSYDIPNQYRIIYEIVKYIRDNTDKKVLIFTHNSDALNIANQYKYGCNFKFYYVEKYNNELSIEPLTINTNVINIDNIVNSYDDDGFLRANRDRENPLLSDPTVTAADLHKLFHYNGSFSSCTYNGKALSNQQLFDIIDGYIFGTITNEGFIKNTVKKVTYLMGVRVYVEKKLFDISPVVSTALSSINLFGEKLKEIQDHYLSDAVAKYANFDMEILK